MQMMFQLVMKFLFKERIRWPLQKLSVYSSWWCMVNIFLHFPHASLFISFLRMFKLWWLEVLISVLHIIKSQNDSYIFFIWPFKIPFFSLWHCNYLIYFWSTRKFYFRCLHPCEIGRKYYCWWNISFLLCFSWSQLGTCWNDTNEMDSRNSGLNVWCRKWFPRLC